MRPANIHDAKTPNIVFGGLQGKIRYDDDSFVAADVEVAAMVDTVDAVDR